MSKDRRLTLMRWALTRATAKWGIGGRLKDQGKVKPISLGGRMSKTFTTIHVVMRNGAPVGAYADRNEAAAHARAIGGPGEGHSIALVTLELVHGPRTRAGQEHQLDIARDRQEKRR